MQVSFEILKYFRLVKVRTLEDLETIKKILLNDLTDTEFLVVFYLGLVSDWGVNLDRKKKLRYCEKPKEHLAVWVAWYLGYTKEYVRKIIGSIERKVYNAFYGTNFTRDEFLMYLAERKRIDDEILKEKVLERYHELLLEGERNIPSRIGREFGISKTKYYSIVNQVTKDSQPLKI